MLMKMGWGGSGTGLGTKNQGIDSPVQAADVRDRNDMYKVCLLKFSNYYNFNIIYLLSFFLGCWYKYK